MWKKISNDNDEIGGFWDFTKNKVLEGTLKSKEANQGPRKNSNLYIAEVDGNEVKFWGSTVLDGKMESVEKHYGFGVKVKITYNGMVESKKGSQYKDFDVEVWGSDDAVSKNDVKDEDIPVIDADNIYDEAKEKVDLRDIPF